MTLTAMLLVAILPAEGQCHLKQETRPDQSEVCFQGDRSNWLQSEYRELVADFDLCLGGRADEPELTGNVNLKEGKWRFRKFGQDVRHAVDEAVAGGEWIHPFTVGKMIRRELSGDSYKLPQNDTLLWQWIDHMNIELTLRVDRNVFFINRDYPEMEIALEGELKLVKLPRESAQLYGSLNMPHGHIRTLNRHFQLEKGMMIFRGDPHNPELDIRTLHQPDGTSNSNLILFTIKGKTDQPEFGYYREGDRNLQEILTYDLFGVSSDQFSEWVNVLTGNSDDNLSTVLARELLKRRKEPLAGNLIGIDMIEVYNANNANGIKLKKNILNELVMTYTQDLDGQAWDRQVLLQYRLGNNVEMSVSGSDFSGNTALIQWKYDY